MEDDVQIEVVEDQVFLMDQLVQRLKMLNYERDFLTTKGMKPLSPGYFINSINPTEQFNYFKNLSKWLLQMCDMNVSDLSKYEDPITVSTNIQTQCKKLEIPCDFPALKLKNGFGEQIIFLLHQLSGKAMSKKKFSFKKPKYQASAAQNVQIVEGKNDEDEADSIQSAQQQIEELQQGGYNKIEIEEEKQIIVTNVNEKDWQLQCKRVAAKLKLPSKSDAKQWRTHVDSTRSSAQNIKQNFPKCRLVMQKINQDLSKNLQRISKAEKGINQQMSGMGTDYKQKAQNLKSTSIVYNNLNMSIKQMNDQYRKIQDRLETVNTQINEQSNSMSDNSKLVKIMAAIQKITGQIKSMDVRIGVLNYTVFQQRMKQRRVDDRGDMGFNVLQEFGEQS